jgi:hypothetical protein
LIRVVLNHISEVYEVGQWWPSSPSGISISIAVSFMPFSRYPIFHTCIISLRI